MADDTTAIAPSAKTARIERDRLRISILLVEKDGLGEPEEVNPTLCSWSDGAARQGARDVLKGARDGEAARVDGDIRLGIEGLAAVDEGAQRIAGLRVLIDGTAIALF